MSENITIALIALLSTLFGGGLVTAFVALRKSKSEVKVLDTQGVGNIAKVWTEASLLVSSVLNEAQEQNEELRKQGKEAREANALLEKRLVELEKGATEDKRLLEKRNKQHAESNEKIEALQAGMEALNTQIEKDTQETQSLRGEVQTLRGKIADASQQIAELQLENERYVRINKKLIQALNDAKIPLPDFNGDLTESQKVKAVKK